MTKKGGNRKNATIKEADAMNEQDDMNDTENERRKLEAKMLSKKSKKIRNSDDEFERDEETTDIEGDNDRQELSATAIIAAGEITKTSSKK